MQQPLQAIPGLPGLPQPGLPQLPPGFSQLGALPPGLPTPGVPPGLSALLAGLPGAPPGLPPQAPPQNIDWIAQLAAVQAVQAPQIGTAPPAPGAGLQLGTATAPGTGGISPPSLAAWGLGGGAFPTAAPGGLPPGLPAVPTLPQGWGQPNDTLAALLGGAVGQATSDGSALALSASSALPPGTAVATTTVPPQMPPPQMPPPQMPPPLAPQLQALPPGMAPPPGAPAPPPPAAPSASQMESARREEERKEQMRRENKEKAEKREKLEQVEKKKCHLHKKLKDSCRFCKKYKELLDELERSQKKEEERPTDNRSKRRLDRAISEERDGGQAEIIPIADKKNFGFTGLLQTHIVECAHFKSLLTLETFEQLVDETYQFANAVEPYMANSGTLPTALFCCVYRFFTMGLDSRQLRRLFDAQESAYLRCAGFLYARYGLAPDQLWDWVGDYILDDEVFKPQSDSDYQITIGEYVEGILSQDKYYQTVFPRLPGSTKRKLEERLAPVGQYRKRTKANKEILDVYRDPGTKVEACIDGDWLKGSIIELDDGRPNRVKAQLRLEDGSEDTVHLGMIIMADERSSKIRARGRSRSRSPGGSRIDWSRYKGRSDKELIDEMRSRDREKAVCSTGKDYARKPVGYKAACALPREQGAASYRLMEEETFVPMSRGSTRGRTPSPQRENFGGKRPSAEHQARMQQLFEKYGNVKSAEARSHSSLEVERPDVMRLG